MEYPWSNVTNSTSLRGPVLLSMSLSYHIICIFAIALHILVTVAVFKTIKRQELNSFYIFTLNLYATNVLTYLVYALYGSPCILAQRQIYGELGAKIMGAVQTADFIASIFLTFLISINRALAIGNSKWNDIVFRTSSSIFLVFCSWIFGVLTIVWNFQVSCFTLFDETIMNFKAVCAPGIVSSVVSPSSIAVYLGVYGVGVFYVYAGYVLWKQYRQIQMDQVRELTRGRGARLLYQAFFIWLSLLANVLGKRAGWGGGDMLD